METTTIQISKHVKKKLDDLKKRNAHGSFDSVIRSLIEECQKRQAYWAGIIDGEGSIVITKQTHYGERKRSPNYILKLCVTNTSRKLLEDLKDFFGVGSVQPRFSQKTLENMCRRQVYNYVADRGSAIKVIEKTLPFLRLKKSQAELAIRYVKSIANYSGKVGFGKKGFEKMPEEEIAKRDAFYLEMKKLNKGGMKVFATLNVPGGPHITTG